MPIYEYKCDDCGDLFEVLVSMGCRDQQTCPNCGHKGATKMVSGGGFILKGGGWYADGYSKAKEGE